jgi:tripartite-type tricarboxylate transporter receptor subunit TctC
MIMLRKPLIAVVAMLSSIAAAQAQGTAQATWPDRPIKFIVHVAAGGGVDLNARILADRLNQQLPQRVLIENMGGGGGTIAARQVANSAPDGYTFLFAGPGHAAAPFLQKQPAYDPIKDFVPVTLVTKFPLVMVIGGSSHIPAEAFAKRAGVQMTHVPFRGNGPSSAALLGGQIDMIVDGLAPQLGNIAEGRVRVLGVTTAERTPFLPDVPAISEALPGFQFPMWVALFAPAGTPKPIVERLAAEVGKAMQDPVTKKRYADVKVDPVGSSPAAFDAFFREQLKFNEDVIKSAGIQQD